MNDYFELIITLIKQPIIRAILFIMCSFLAAQIADWGLTSVLSRLVNPVQPVVRTA